MESHYDSGLGANRDVSVAGGAGIMECPDVWLLLDFTHTQLDPGSTWCAAIYRLNVHGILILMASISWGVWCGLMDTC